MLDPAARLILAAGLVKPIFAPGADDLWTMLGAFMIAIGSWIVAAYLIMSLEDEE